MRVRGRGSDVEGQGLKVIEGEGSGIRGQESVPPWDSTLRKGSSTLMLTSWPLEKRRHLVPCWSVTSSWPSGPRLAREGAGPRLEGAEPEATPSRRRSSENKHHRRGKIKGCSALGAMVATSDL